MLTKHQEKVKTKVLEIAKIETEIQGKIDNVVALGTSCLKRKIDITEYADYLLLPDEDQKKQDLLYAEAYYTLFYFINTLKELKEDVFATSENFGKGQISYSSVDETIKLQETYKKYGDEFVKPYLTKPEAKKGIRCAVI